MERRSHPHECDIDPFYIVLLSFLKSLPWPIVVGFAAYLYRDQITDLIPRVRELGPTGAKFDPVEQQNRTEDKLLAPAVPLNLTPALKKKEIEIRASLKDIQDEQKFSKLVFDLSVFQMSWIFERAYGSIFGSQIRLMRHLHNRRSVYRDEAVSFYNEAKVTSPAPYSNYTFEQWIAYIESFGFVVRDSGKILITDVGDDFVVYITSQRLTGNRAL